jgi:DnaJ-class molecular chaperone
MAERSVPAPRVCGTCRGAAGHTETTNRDGVTIQTWHPCGPCHGTGTQGGGI